MLEIDVSLEESYDETTGKFASTKNVRVVLEHSLVSVSKWESAWKVPFLSKEDKTPEQTLSYVGMMILGDQPAPEVFHKLVSSHLKEIKDYIEDKMTATRINEIQNGQGRREIITAELIYYWMISMNIPIELERWHLNRLVTLIRVINIKNSPKKKMTAAERTSLNKQRLAKHKTRG